MSNFRRMMMQQIQAEESYPKYIKEIAHLGFDGDYIVANYATTFFVYEVRVGHSYKITLPKYGGIRYAVVQDYLPLEEPFGKVQCLQKNINNWTKEQTVTNVLGRYLLVAKLDAITPTVEEID